MSRILVSRFSAMGDVIISVHVIKALVRQNPDVEIILLTKPFFRSFFNEIERVSTFEVDLKDKHKGVLGLKKLSREIYKKYNIEYYADIHDVIRSRLIHLFLPFSVKKAKINKGRAEKRKLIRKKHKKLYQLKHSAERYADVFRKLGFKLDLSIASKPRIIPHSEKIKHIIDMPHEKIGIAAFAKHKSKTYSLARMENLISEISKEKIVLLFGGGKSEKEITEKWENKYENVISVIGKYSMSDELALINHCQSIITMDSSNMHLASLTNTKILSIWCGTHPYLGFYAFNKNNAINIQKDISCRPCSVFGGKKCYKGTWECTEIDEKIILNNL